MKKLVFLVVLILLIIPVLNVVGSEVTITHIDGQVERMVEKSIFFNLIRFNKWQQLTVKDKLKTGDVIRTGSEGNLEFFFDNGTFLKIGEETQFEIGEGKITELGKAYSLHLKAGRIWAKVKGAWKELTKFEVVTPSAVAGVKGTLFSVSVEKDRTIVSVQEGQIEVRNNTDTEQKLIGHGQMGLVIDNHISLKEIDKEEEKFWNIPDLNKWVEVITEGNNEGREPGEDRNEEAREKAEKARDKARDDKDEGNEEEKDNKDNDDKEHDEDKDNEDQDEEDEDEDENDGDLARNENEDDQEENAEDKEDNAREEGQENRES